MPLEPVKLRLLALLMLCALNSTGCSAPLSSPPAPVAIQCPSSPPPPKLSHPIPLQTYSDSARQKFRNWQEQLTPTPPTPKP